MGLFDLFNKHESLLSIDIGSCGIKLIEFDSRGDKPLLVNLGFAPLTPDVFSGSLLGKTERVAEQLHSLLEANNITGKRVSLAMPGPSVITKRIKMPKQNLNDLSASIQFEASNFIPHNIDAVRLDFHILGESGNQYDILVVAVKNEVIDSFLECLTLVGLEAAVVDVDYFALQNMFELNYPALIDQTSALLNIGARYSSINICQGGASLFTGDIPVGGKLFTDLLVEQLGVSEAEAEKKKRAAATATEETAEVRELIDQKVEYVAGEISRQLSFFWNAAGSDAGIQHLFVSGGGSLTPGLIDELSEKTGLKCERIDPFQGVECGESIDTAALAEFTPIMGVSVGLGLRQAGDRDLSAIS